MPSTENKIVKTFKDASIIVGLTTGIGYGARMVLKQSFLGDPSANVANFGKLTLVVAGSIALKTYLEDKDIIPDSL